MQHLRRLLDFATRLCFDAVAAPVLEADADAAVVCLLSVFGSGHATMQELSFRVLLLFSLYRTQIAPEHSYVCHRAFVSWPPAAQIRVSIADFPRLLELDRLLSKVDASDSHHGSTCAADAGVPRRVGGVVEPGCPACLPRGGAERSGRRTCRGGNVRLSCLHSHAQGGTVAVGSSRLLATLAQNGLLTPHHSEYFASKISVANSLGWTQQRHAYVVICAGDAAQRGAAGGAQCRARRAVRNCRNCSRASH